MGAATSQTGSYRVGRRKSEILGDDWEVRLAEARARRSVALAARGSVEPLPEKTEKPWENEDRIEVPTLIDENDRAFDAVPVADHAPSWPDLPDESEIAPPVTPLRDEARIGRRNSSALVISEAVADRERRVPRWALLTGVAFLALVPLAGYELLNDSSGLRLAESLGMAPGENAAVVAPEATETAALGPAKEEAVSTALASEPALGETPQRNPAAPKADAESGPVLAAGNVDTVPATSDAPDQPVTAMRPADARMPRLPDPLGRLGPVPVADVPEALALARVETAAPPTLPERDEPLTPGLGDHGALAPLALENAAVSESGTASVAPVLVETGGRSEGPEADLAPRLAMLDAGRPVTQSLPPLVRPAGPDGEAPAIDPAAPPPPAPAVQAEPSFAGTVHFHAPGTVDPERVAREADLVADATGLAISLEPAVSFKISTSNVRYFHDADRAAAAAVAEELSARLRDFTAFEPAPDPGTIEVWIAGEPASSAPATVAAAPKPAAPKPAPAATARREPVTARPVPSSTFQTTTITRTRRSGIGRLFGN